MKIKISEFWLCEDGQLAPNSLRINGRRSSQIAQILRAAAAKVWNRQNTVTTISFSVVREHDTTRAAEEYMLQHEVNIPSGGIVTFFCTDEHGAESVFYFDAGALDTTEAAQIGVSTEHSYTLLGGRITNVKPTA
jgi:hypothetical protein